MKAIPGEFQHELVVADIYKKIRNAVGKNVLRKDKFAERCEDQEAI